MPHIINTFRGGLSQETNKGIAGAFKNWYWIDIRKDDDTLSCNSSMTKESSTTVVDLIKYQVVCSTWITYGFWDTGKIYARSSGWVWSVLATDSDGEIHGAYEWNGRIYYATDTKLKYVTASAPDFTSPTTASSSLTSANTHSMAQVAGALYFCNSNSIGIVDTAFVVWLTALVLPPDLIAQTIEESNGYMVVGARKNNGLSESHLITWNTTTLTWEKRFKLASRDINAIINGEYIIAHAGGNLYLSDMAHHIPLHRIENSVMNPNAVCLKDGMVLMWMHGCSIPWVYSYGRKKENLPLVLNMEYMLSPWLNVTEIGSVKMYGSLLLVSWKAVTWWVTSYGVDVITSTKATARYESLEWYCPPSYIRPIQLGNIKVITKALPAGTSYSLQYRVDKSNSWTSALTVSWDSSFSTTWGVESYWMTQHEAMNIYEIAITLNPSTIYTPDIVRIETEIIFPPEQTPLKK